MYRKISYDATIFFIRAFYGLLHLFLSKRRRFPKKDFEENPRTMGWRWALYLGYKCFYAPHKRINDPLYGEEYFRSQQLPLSAAASRAEELTINIAGDMKQHELFTVHTTRHLRDDIGQAFFDADTVIANLETPMDLKKKTRTDPMIMLHDLCFNAHKRFYDIFTAQGKRRYSLLLTANNHCLDQGEEGNRMTCRFLDEHKIPYTWSRLSEEEPRYRLITQKGMTVGYINYTFSCNQNVPSEGYTFAINYLRLNIPDTDISQITDDVRSAKAAGADFIVLCPHMGNSYQRYPSGHIVRMVHRFFDECGVDAVICTHPHNLQPMEIYAFVDPNTGKRKQWFVVYSLGDFVSYDIFPRSHLSGYVQLRLAKTKDGVKLASVQYVPLYMHQGKDSQGPVFRLLDLKRLMSAIEEGEQPSYLDLKSQEEAISLSALYKKIVPQA